MERPSAFVSDRRGLNTTLAHALTLSITAVLIIGLITATTGFFESEREQVAREELRTVGNRIASDAMQATSLADSGGVTNITTEHPERVAGLKYSAEVRTGSDCHTDVVKSDTCLFLETNTLDVEVLVPVYNQTGFELEATTQGEFTVTTLNDGGTTTTTAASRVTDVELSSQVGVGSTIQQVQAVSLAQPGNSPPSAAFTFSPEVPRSGSNITFNATPSTDIDGSINEYRWDFDDDDAIDKTTTSPVTSWQLPPGPNTVELNVSDGNGGIGSTSQVIDVSGLTYGNDLDTFDGDDTATFTVTNDFAEAVELQQLLVDPEPSIASLDETTSDHEVELDLGDDSSANPETYVDYGSGVSLSAGGAFVNFAHSGSTATGYLTVPANSVVRFRLERFSSDVEGEEITFGVRYEKDGTLNSTVFTDTVGGPDVSNYQVTASGKDVDVSFDATHQLDTIEATVNGTVNKSLSIGDFSESGSGPYTYTADVSSGTNGTFNVTLTEAKTSGTSTGDAPISQTVVVGASSDVTWETDSDWDGVSVTEGSVVHADFGDHSKDVIEAGYSQSGSGLVGYWPLDDPGDGTATDESGNGNDGTVSGNPTTTNGIGDSDAYLLDGVDDQIRIDTHPGDTELDLDDEDTVTVSAWVNKQSAQSSKSWVAIFQHSDKSYNLQFHNGNQPEFTIYSDGEQWKSAVLGNGVGSNDWVHLVGTFDGEEIALYKNGGLEDTTCQNPHPVFSWWCRNGEIDEATADAGIGENIDSSGRNLHGKVDEIRVYDRALSDSEVETLYETFERTVFETNYKTTGASTGDLDVENLKLQYDVTSDSKETVQVKVIADNGDESDWVTVPDGEGSVAVSGMSTDDDRFKLRVRLDSDAGVPTESPSVTKLGVSD